MSSADRSSSVPSFLICVLFISLSYLIALARTSGTTWNMIGESGYPALFPILGESILPFTINYNLSGRFFLDAFHQVGEVPL